MGYLAIEIIALLGGAAVLGFIVGWAIFGLGKKKPVAAATGLAPANPKLEADYKVAVDARKKAEGRIVELEAKEANFNDRLQERDAKVAELSHQLDDLAKIRVEAAAEKSQREQKDQRIAALETQLRQRDADLTQLAAGVPGGTVALDLQAQLAERDRQIAKLKVELEALSAASSPDAPKVTELQAEIAELRATLVATAGAAPTTASEKDAIIGRLNEEVTGLRAAYEAAEQALEEQDQAIDKLTRELVTHQQRVATLEGREPPPVAAKPTTGQSVRPTPTPVTQTPVAPAPKPTTPQVADNERTVALSVVDHLRKLDAETTLSDQPEPTFAEGPRVMAPPTGLIDSGEKTVAVSLSDLVSRVDSSPLTPVTPAPAPAPAPVAAKPLAEENESTIAIPLADLVSQIDAAPSAAAAPAQPPGPPPALVEANESTVAISLADLVDQIDQPRPPTPPPVQVEENESTVAISLADLVDQIDQKPPGPPPMQVEENERTVAFVLPEGLDEDAEERRRDGTDDLKMIKGIGPATEKRLKGAGITKWAQVAELKDSDLPAIADLLKVSVDKIKPWVEQAKALRP
ncbi:MAG: hypothetical protein U1F43_06130 [Myxococcota bacterium]